MTIAPVEKLPTIRMEGYPHDTGARFLHRTPVRLITPNVGDAAVFGQWLRGKGCPMVEANALIVPRISVMPVMDGTKMLRYNKRIIVLETTISLEVERFVKWMKQKMSATEQR
jgi:hypothetical protein